MRSPLFPLGPGAHETLCVPPRVEFLFPPVLWNSCNQTPLAFKARFSGVSSSRCQTLRLGSLTWGLELSLLWENFCDIIIFQFVGRPPSMYEIWSYHSCTPPTVSLWLLLCLWMSGIFFGRFQCSFVDGCSAVSCDFGVSVRRSELMSFYSAILSVIQGDILETCPVLTSLKNKMNI